MANFFTNLGRSALTAVIAIFAPFITGKIKKGTGVDPVAVITNPINPDIAVNDVVQPIIDNIVPPAPEQK